MTEPTSPAPGAVRLNKRMAELGICSRREADDWIAQGWVKVNGKPAEMGVKVTPADRVEVDRQAEQHQQQQVTIILHKPMGYVSGQPEDGHEAAVALINPRTHWREDPSRNRFSPPQLRGLAPAGRLDIDSVGLLVLTQDGRVARQLIGEDSGMEKEYLVRVAYHGLDQPAPVGQLIRIDDDDPITSNVKAMFPPALLERLRFGLSLDGQPLKRAQVDWQNPEQLRFVLTEGKKRQIRRMCELVGLKVVGLKRIRIGRVVLGNLPAGQWRYLGPNERF
jgi:23S rRNA pseudouridine2604 synthase